MIMRFLRRFPFAIRGISKALRTDYSFKTQFWGGLVILIPFSYFVWPLTETEVLFLGLSYILVLITELQNSSFETALDRLHPDQHVDIGKSKDMASGAVLLAGVFALCVFVTITLTRIL